MTFIIYRGKNYEKSTVTTSYTLFLPNLSDVDIWFPPTKD